MSPTPGWMNFDNSISLRLASYPKVSQMLFKARLLTRPQMDYIQFCQTNSVQWADATKRLPLADESVNVVYSSHMLEHLDRKDACVFLQEAYRVLMIDGIIRLSVPDIRKKVELYNTEGDADAFVESTMMCIDRPRSFVDMAKLLVVGMRHHQWMYDGKSLSRLLLQAGFSTPTVLPPGQTLIADAGHLNLSERDDESVYVEAVKR